MIVSSSMTRTVRTRFFRPFWSPLLPGARYRGGAPGGGAGAANALARGPKPMNLLQVALQQRGRPGRGAVAVVARVAVDDRVDQRVDDPQGRRGSSAAGGIEQALRHAQIGSVPERLGPIVDGLAAHQEE